MRVYFRFLRQALAERIFSPRMYAVAFLHGFLLHFYMRAVVRFSKDMECAATPWAFPFLLSNIFFLLLFMAGVVYCFSDVPFMQHKNMYQVIRTGRSKWALGQISVIAAQAFFIMVFNAVFSIILLLGYFEYSPGWGKLYHTLALTGGSKKYRFLFDFSYETMQIYSPLELLVLSIMLGTLVIAFVGIFMFAVSLYVNRSLAVTLAFFLVMMIYLVENMYPLLKRWAAMFAPVNWMRVTQIGIKFHDSFIQPPVWYMVTMLAAGIAICAGMVCVKVKKIEFQWYQEE